MKKYEKPQLFMEEFTMAESIARCGINHPADGNDQGMFDWASTAYADACSGSLDMGGGEKFVIFLSQKCADDGGEIYTKEEFEQIWDGYCYQGNTNGGAVIFHS